MKVLITSGGTKVPLDPVRDITNHSKGTFGSKIAKEFLRTEKADVIFFCAEYSATPFTFNCDLHERGNDLTSLHSEIIQLGEFHQNHKDRYKQVRFRNYDDYATNLKRLIKEEKPDIVVLAAAVSDYVTDATDQKIRSKKDLNIKLQVAEKLIGQVKKLCPWTCLVGFKLLVDSTKKELADAAIDSIKNNNCDLVVANEWNTLKAGNHQLLLVEEDRQIDMPGDARDLVEYILGVYVGKGHA